MIEPLPRRRFLKASVALPVAVSAVVQSACSFVESDLQMSGVYQTEQGRYACFNNDQLETLLAFCGACLAVSPQEVLEAQVVRRLDEELYFVSNTIREDFLLALTVMEYVPLAYGKFSRFSKLSPESQAVFLSSLKETRSDTIRSIIHSLRMVVMLMFYGHESSWAQVQYDGPHARLSPLDSEQRKHYRALIAGPDNA